MLDLNWLCVWHLNPSSVSKYKFRMRTFLGQLGNQLHMLTHGSDPTCDHQCDLSTILLLTDFGYFSEILNNFFSYRKKVDPLIRSDI